MLLIGISHEGGGVLGRDPMVKGGTEGGDPASPTKYKGRTGEFQIKVVVQFVNTKRLFG